MKRTVILPLLSVILAGCAQSPSDVSLFPANKAKKVNIDTHLVLTFKEAPTVGTSGFIRVFDAATGEAVDSLDLSLPAGLTQSRTYGDECDYIKTPYDYSREFMATNRNTVPGTPSGGAEPTPRDMQLNIIGGFTDGFRFHPVIVHDNTATIYLHNNMLEYGHRYSVTIDEGAIVAEGFKGISKGEWTFSTKASGPKDIHHLSVDCSGKADFSTVQGALDAIADFDQDTTWVNVAAGDYEEIVYARNKSYVVLTGAGMDETKVHYANNEVFNPHPLLLKTNEKFGTFPSRRAAFALDNCADIIIEGMTIATDLYGQAEGLLLNGERIAMYDVRIIGSGDALQANGTVYMEDSEIDGGGDTILGRGSLFAYHCKFINDGGPFSWIRNFKPAHGDVFVECHFEGKEGRQADFGRSGNNHGQIYPDAEFVVINCTTRNFNPLGWSAIGMPTNNMLEFATRDADSGQLVDVSQRHAFSRQLDAVADAAIIANYSNPAFVLNGWLPERH